MTSFDELLEAFSRPRPNGSKALRETFQFMQGWLQDRNISFTAHPFRIYPYSIELTGFWLLVTILLLVASAWLTWGWAAPIILAVGMSLSAVPYALRLPQVHRLGAEIASNLVIPFEPLSEPRQELVLTAHYDSKSELLDHRQRMFLLRSVPTIIILAVICAGSTGLVASLRGSEPYWSQLFLDLGTAVSIPLLLLAVPLALNLMSGRIAPQSQGAVDNGAACVVLLSLAEKLSVADESLSGKGQGSLTQPVKLENTLLKIILFCGEEVDRQGSTAYVRAREWPLPSANLNLEVLAQDGPYVLWTQGGNIFHLMETDPHLNRLVTQAVEDVTGAPPILSGPVLSDGAPFLEAGIPSTTLGTFDKEKKDTGFHSPADNLQRIVPSRLPEAVDILLHFLKQFDEQYILIQNTEAQA